MAFFALIALAASAGTGCTSRGNAARPGLISRWEKVLGRSAAETGGARRSIADFPGARCLRDRVTATHLRSDIARREARRGGVPVSGRWRTIDRATLPPAQGEFLGSSAGEPARGDWLYGAGIDFSPCTDVPCIINQVYGRPGGDEGLKVYWWFLRTGYKLSCTDVIPGVTLSGSRAYRDQLFSDAELTAFWKLSWLLPDSFFHLRGLQTFHRMARREFLVSWKEAGSCGDASGGGESGYVRLGDGCLKLDGYSEELDAHFFHAVTHEIAHKVDYAISGSDSEMFSTSAGWTKFSGWYQPTVTDPKTGKQRKEGWSFDPSLGGFIGATPGRRAYGTTYPYEDWADMVANVRFRAEELKQAARANAAVREKVKFISEKVYGGRTYDGAGLSAAYEDQAYQAVAPELAELVQACVSGTSAAGESSAAVAGAVHLTFETPIPAQVVGCLERGLNERVSVALERVRASEWEACDFLATNELDVRAKVFLRVNPEISRLATEAASLAPLIRASLALRKDLELDADSREAYLHCYAKEDAETCYVNALTDRFDRLAMPYLSDLGVAMGRERDSFLKANPFSGAAARVHEYFRQIFAGSERLLTAAAGQAWKTCFALPENPRVEDDVVPTVPFTGGDRYVSSTLLTCLNSRAESDVESARDRFAARLGVSVSDPDAAALVREMLLPGYLAVLSENSEREGKREHDEYEKRRGPSVGRLTAKLQATAGTWATGVPSWNAALSLCVGKAKAEFDADLAAQAALPLRFMAIEDLRLTWIQEACERTVKWMKGSSKGR